MATPAEHIDQIIADSLALVDEQTQKVEHYADFAIDVANGGQPTVINPYTWTKEVEAVEPTIPTVDDPTRVYEVERDAIIALLTAQLADFLTTYYPLVNDAYDEATAWLVNTITLGGTGIPAAIEDQIWQRGRDRITTESRRVKNQIVSGYSARGFMLPSGRLRRDLRQVDLAGIAASGENSTSIAVKQIEIEIDNIKFAVEKALDARMTALGAATDYIRSLAIAPDIAMRLAEVDSDVQARMMSATSDLYRARLSRDELIMNTEVARMRNFQTDQTAFYDTYVRRIQQGVNGTISAADVFGKTSQAALSSLNTVASMGSSSFD